MRSLKVQIRDHYFLNYNRNEIARFLTLVMQPSFRKLKNRKRHNRYTTISAIFYQTQTQFLHGLIFSFFTTKKKAKIIEPKPHLNVNGKVIRK
jgi:hypothetical protein